MPDLKSDADKFSFILAELRSHTKAQTETHKDIAFIKERLFIKRNGNPSLEAQVDSNADDIKLLQNNKTQFVKNFYAPIIVGIVVAAVIIVFNLIPK